MNKNPVAPLFTYLVFAVAFLERTVFDLGPNVELVTLAMLLASTCLSRSTALKLTFALMAATDLFIGNTSIFIFTWTGFLLPIILIKLLVAQPFRSPVLPAGRLGEGGSSVFKVTTLGIASNLFFFLWTNFGVWLLDSWGMYPDTLAGLGQSYVAGLPFLKLQLLSTVVFVPSGFILLRWLSGCSFVSRRHSALNLLP